MGKHMGESHDLSSLLESSHVNVSLLANDEGKQEPIKCTIKRARSFLRDEIIFTSDIALRDADEVTGVV